MIALVALVSAILAFELGCRFSQINRTLQELLQKEVSNSGVVTPLPAGTADPVNASSIVTPKSPDQIEREERDRVRDLV